MFIPYISISLVKRFIRFFFAYFNSFFIAVLEIIVFRFENSSDVIYSKGYNEQTHEQYVIADSLYYMIRKFLSVIWHYWLFAWHVPRYNLLSIYTKNQSKKPFLEL